ncbi:hypothetical protein [Capnocytophaga catalasegens]|uniref:hypothetical protein n=1 Tax=Capnocytophaga catalasegens TaxID=1004260 RepID=UPI00222E5F58|nr:hypothetical protein [Capnocytophaga catalasegens]
MLVVAEVPFSVSFVSTLGTVPPALPMVEVGSSTASIVLTTTLTSALSQILGFALSQI